MNPEYLNSILRYNPESGALTWKQSKRMKRGGQQAGYTTRKRGLRSRSINIDGKAYKVDGVIIWMATGVYPVDVEHLNGDYTDCRWDNMRASDSLIRNKPRMQAVKLYRLPKALEISIARYQA